MATKEIELAGKKFKVTTDRMAMQASGSVVAQYGDTVVLAAAVLGKEKPGLDYFPLLVDYEERLYAAGKIKGSRFIKREGRATDEAILSGRLIDRGIRPLFDSDTRNEVQVVATILSVDEENDSDIIACNAAACALMISNIPWNGPLATARVGKVDGQYVLNPTYAEREKSSLDLVISSTGESILMVEAGASQVSEEEIIEAMRFAEGYLKDMANFQKELAREFGKEKSEVARFIVRDEIKEAADGQAQKIEEILYKSADKEEREGKLDALKKEFIASQQKKFAADDSASADLSAEASAKAEAVTAFEKVTKGIIRSNILDKEKRVDGRPLTETRKVTAEVGVLPRTHGSSLFQRGETQVLTVVTLGSPGDEQILDGMEDFGEVRKRYIHHYNFPGYSVGEVSPNRGPGRREVGHGALAERALEPIIPGKEAFPYTIRLVSEVLSSNGSTSMASTCGSSLALMDAGVPTGATIGGVAMGLVLDTESGNFKVLTDIQGLEDGNGDMDFKVTGSRSGVTALQMDVKTRGLTVDILEKAIAQAKDGRLHILSVMETALSAPRSELSKYAPRITSFTIDPDKIRTVIGSGGKTINEIIAATGVKIDIEDSGLVMITSTDGESAERAEKWIKDLIREVKAGEEFHGKVTRIMEFGAFVEILPGKEGMVHVSKLSGDRVENVSDAVKVGDELDVVVSEIDFQGRINLITKAALAAGKTGERPPRTGGDRNGGGRGGFRRGR